MEADDESLASNAETTKKNDPLILGIHFVVAAAAAAAAAAVGQLLPLVGSNRFDSFNSAPEPPKRQVYKFLLGRVKIPCP